MKTTQEWLDAYGVSHQNPTNKFIHWICVPAIMFSIFGLLMAIPLPFTKSLYLNIASIATLFVLIFYIRLSIPIFLGFILIGGLMLLGNYQLLHILGGEGKLAIASLIIFVVAWVGQFIGHKIEGAKPSFFEDLQFLLIGPMWLLHFIYKKIGLKY